MSHLAHTVPASTSTPAGDALPTHPSSSTPNASGTLLLPLPNAEQQEAVAASLAQMAAQLTAPVETIELIEDIEPEPDSEPTPVAPVSRVVSVPPPAPLRSATRALVPVKEERAELELEDLSLRDDNPYRASSLIPPARRGLGKAGVWSICGALTTALLGFAAYAGYLPPPAARSAPIPAAQAHTSAIVTGTVTTPAPALAAAPAKAEVESAPTLAAPALEGASAETLAFVSMMAAAQGPTQAEPSVIKAPRGKRGNTVTHAQRGRRSRSSGRAAKNASKAKKPAMSAPAQVGSAAPSKLPKAPSRQQILAGLSQLRGEITRCAGGQHGIAEVHATILSSGRISRPHVAGVFEGTPASLCMERAVRNFGFEPFSDPQVRVTFPFAL